MAFNMHSLKLRATSHALSFTPKTETYRYYISVIILISIDNECNLLTFHVNLVLAR